MAAARSLSHPRRPQLFGVNGVKTACEEHRDHKDVRISLTKTSLKLYKSGFSGSSDTWTFSYSIEKECYRLVHRCQFGMYFDDLGNTSYDLSDPERNRSVKEYSYESPEKLVSEILEVMKAKL